MNARKVAGALLLVTGLATSAGCADDGDQGSQQRGAAGTATSTATASHLTPVDELIAGIKATAAGGHRYEVKSGDVTGEGVGDGAQRVGRSTITITVSGKPRTVETVLIGTDVYLRMVGETLPGVPSGRYAHIDATRLKSMHSLGIQSPEDPSGLLALAGALGSVERTAPRSFRGSYDLTKRGAAPNVLKGLGDKAKDIQFEARLDERGQLVWIVWTVPSLGDDAPVRTETSFSDLGKPVVVDRPSAAQVVEAPPNLYKTLDQ